MRFQRPHVSPTEHSARRHTTPHPFTALPAEIAFLLKVGVHRADLLSAAEAARRLHVCPARVLIASGKVDAGRYYQALAFELGVPFIVDAPRLAEPIDPSVAYRLGCLRLAPGSAAAWLLAPRDATLRSLLRARDLGWPRLAITTPAHLAALIQDHAEAAVQDVATEVLPRQTPRFSAKGACGAGAGFGALFAGLLVACICAFVPRLGGDLLGLLFFAGMSFRLLIGADGLAAPIPRDALALSDAELPDYTILVPLRDEAAMVPDLIAALEKIDYPRAKLDVLLIVEPEDRSTRVALAAASVPPWIDVIVSPRDTTLRTKPRALNIGLMAARGALLTVYDAEDRPEPDQLRRAALAFAENPDLDCIQARLAVDNGDRSWLARLFAIEYAGLFDVFNVGLTCRGLPLPLGGTSNHFQMSVLRAAGGWDAWNVTEDADLGLRFARLGFCVGGLASTTKEAAPDEIGVWMRQRRRWMKGWIQTFLVLMRDAPSVVKALGWGRSAAMVLLAVNLVGGPLLFPVFGVYLTFHYGRSGLPTPRDALQAAEATLEASVLMLGSISIFWFGTVGIWKRRLFRFVPSLMLLPLYQLMISFAAWMSLVDLVRRPYHWHKTSHLAAAADQESAACPDPINRSSPSARRRRRTAPLRSMRG